MTESDKETYNEICRIAREEDVFFVDYNECYKEIGLDFANDFNDNSHLNYWGSCKFTSFLGENLRANFHISNKAGWEGYESWDENTKLILEELEIWKEETFSNLLF